MNGVESSNLKILVAEDEALVAEAIREQLRRAGHVVTHVVDTGEDAVCSAAETSPDVIVMDIRLRGETDGIAAASRIRERLDIPVVFLTAHSDRATLDRAMASAPFGYVVKPFQERDLLIAINVAASRHRLEQELRASEQKYVDTLSSVADGVITTDLKDRITFMNRAAEILTGCPESEALNRPLTDVVKLVDEFTNDSVENPVPPVRLDEGPLRVAVPLLLVTRAGNRIPVDASVTPLRNGEGVIGTVTALRNMEHRRLLDERLRRSQGLEALGVLASSVAHHFNNILMIVLGNADLELANNSRPESRERLRRITDAARRGGRLTQELLLCSGRDRGGPGSIPLGDLVQGLTELLNLAVVPNCVIRRRIGAGPSEIEGDAGQLHQMIQNLVLNASESIGPGREGILTISTGRSRMQRAELTEYILGEMLSEGEYVYLEVSDTGEGMSAEHKSRAFEPFFTTKDAGRGLGLPQVLGIVRAHHGAVRLDSEHLHGTTVRILFPPTTIPSSEAIEPSIAPASWRGTGCILVVDDEEDIRGVAALMLQALGFSVLTASNGQEAVEIYRAQRERISAVLMDLSMPVMDGVTAWEQMRKESAGVKAILCTGYSRPAGVPSLPILRKPFDFERLRQVVYQLLK